MAERNCCRGPGGRADRKPGLASADEESHCLLRRQLPTHSLVDNDAGRRRFQHARRAAPGRTIGRRQSGIAIDSQNARGNTPPKATPFCSIPTIGPRPSCRAESPGPTTRPAPASHGAERSRRGKRYCNPSGQLPAVSIRSLPIPSNVEATRSGLPVIDMNRVGPIAKRVCRDPAHDLLLDKSAVGRLIIQVYCGKRKPKPVGSRRG